MSLYTDRPDQLYGAPGAWSFSRCESCGLVWLDPRPAGPDLIDLYTTWYHYTHASAKSGARSGLAGAVARGLQAAAFGYAPPSGRGTQVAGRILARSRSARELLGGSVAWLHGRPGGRLLDVGCGSGEFLAHMRELGWQVAGTEPDPAAAKVARDAFGLPVWQGDLIGGPHPPDSFDAITMSHVIEHAADPVALLAKCRELLRPDGELVVVTPNIQSLGRRLLNEGWFLGWSPPWHLFVFSARTLAASAERASLTVDVIRTTARRAVGGWYVNRLLRYQAPIPALANTRRSLSLRLRLGIEGLAVAVLEQIGVEAGRPWGEELVMVASK